MEGTRKRHRFHDFSPAEEVAVVNSVVPKNTKEANRVWDEVYKSFCREKQLGISLETCSAPELADGLKKYYGGLQKKNGDCYQPAGYLSAWAAIQRKLTALKRSFNLRDDAAFRGSNIVLDAVLKRNKTRVSHKVQHEDAITDADKDLAGEYFKDVLDCQDTYKPHIQSYCWYNMTRHLGLHGSQLFVHQNKDDVEFKYAPDGTADGGRIFDKIVLNDHAVIHHLAINVGTTTEQQQ